jgi:hypothetical protein
MNVEQFAEAFKVNTKRDDCNERIVQGKNGSHIFDGYDNRLSVALMFDTKRRWNTVKRKLESAGITIRQDGDTEGIAIFDPADRKQARLALKLAGIRIRRALTPEQRQAMVDRLQHARKVQKMSRAA